MLHQIQISSLPKTLTALLAARALKKFIGNLVPIQRPLPSPKVIRMADHELLTKVRDPESMATRQQTSSRQKSDQHLQAGDFDDSTPIGITVFESCFNLKDFLERCLGDVSMALELLGISVECAQVNLEEIDHELAAKDYRELTRIAHTLKGIAGNMSALPLVKAELERA